MTGTIDWMMAKGKEALENFGKDSIVEDEDKFNMAEICAIGKMAWSSHGVCIKYKKIL